MMIHDTTKMSVEEIRNELVAIGGFERKTVNAIKGKAKLVELLQHAYENRIYKEKTSESEEDNLIDDLFNDVEEVNDIEEDKADEGAPHYTSPLWHDYVISHLTEDEQMDGNPTTDGLRRVTEIVYGTVLQATSDVIQCPTTENDKRATVQHRLVVLRYEDEQQIVVNGSADVYWGNAGGDVFKYHPVATAETRAEGRAFKRLLKLRKVLSAEEVGETGDETIERGSADSITDAQIRMMQTVASHKLDLNLVAFIKKEAGEVDNIKEVKYSKAQELIKTLSSYQSTGVPDELKGYDSNWQFELNK